MEKIVELISFLDKHSGSLTFIVTFVYVIATVVICWANITAANASHDQLIEAKRQFEEDNRAYVSANIEIVRNAFIVLHIQNIGRRVANNVKIAVDSQFIENLPDEFDRNNLNQLCSSSFTLGIGQSFFIAICSNTELEKASKKLLSLNIVYSDTAAEYKEKTLIDLSQYFWALLYQSPMEDSRQELKKMAKGIHSISKSLDKVEKRIKKEENLNV